MIDDPAAQDTGTQLSVLTLTSPIGNPMQLETSEGEFLQLAKEPRSRRTTCVLTARTFRTTDQRPRFSLTERRAPDQITPETSSYQLINVERMNNLDVQRSERTNRTSDGSHLALVISLLLNPAEHSPPACVAARR